MLAAQKTLTAPCGHSACPGCWQTWLTTTLKSSCETNQGVLVLQCPYCRCDLKEYPEFLECDEFELGRDYYEMMYPDFVRR